jgi:subtilase family serine protease
MKLRLTAALVLVALIVTGVCGCHVVKVNTSPARHGSTASPPGAVVVNCLARSLCYAPRQFRAAYGIQPLLDRGITGRGQTVVLLEFSPAGAGLPPAVTDIRQDVVRFDSTFVMPAARLQVVNTLAHAASPWLATEEEVADTEIVHALAPGAAIRVVLIPSTYTASPGTVSAAVAAALRLGLAQGGVIELSAGEGEQCFTPAEEAQVNSALRAAQRDRVTVVMSSGDYGAAVNHCRGARTAAAYVKGVDLPASDPLTLAVGGTSLRASRATGAYIGETAWSHPPPSVSQASGGGFSRLFPRPAYQDGIPGIGATRGVPDVAADADHTGMAFAFSDGSRRYGLTGIGGTSVAAPLWAAVIALADQYAGRHLGFVNPALYQIGRSPSYRQAFHDVTTGTNTVTFAGQTITGYQAGPGWNPVTGWGSPNAQALVPLLARYASP